jgi:hypothetical protein
MDITECRVGYVSDVIPAHQFASALLFCGRRKKLMSAFLSYFVGVPVLSQKTAFFMVIAVRTSNPTTSYFG